MQDAVTEYFDGERLEMLLILGGSLIVMVATVTLFLLSRGDFAKSFMITTLLCAGLLSATALSLLSRDVKQRDNLVSAIQTVQVEKTLREEQNRIATVISKYKYYRYGALALAVLSVLGLFAVRHPLVQGVAAGFLLLVLAQIMIDHYSENRARIYFDRLSSSLATPNP